MNLNIRVVKSINTGIKLFFILSVFFSISSVSGYPIYGSEESGIQRLTGYQTAQTQKAGFKLAKGALLSFDDIKLSLLTEVGSNGYNASKYDQLPVNEALQKSIDSIFKTRDPSYSVVVVDISHSQNIHWAQINPDTKNNVGSVNKILTMVAVFDALAQAFPNIDDRKRILKTTRILAGDWVKYDEHKVPHFDAKSKTNLFSVVSPEDEFSLTEWIDHMISPSANAAGSVVWREAMLIRHFGSKYPVPLSESNAFFKQTPKMTLQALSLQVGNDPLQKVGIDTNQLQQGSFWTSSGKNKVPGVKSYATTRELMRLILLMEQGQLVDAWSSLQMKRYLYMTKSRYRYAYAPELNQSAVFFKSGSLYQCQPEENFRCGKYMGNKTNLMNSVAIIESLPNSPTTYRYMVVLMSNILKKNSAWDHSRLAAAIHQAVLTRTSVEVNDKGDANQIKASGNGDG